MIWQSFDHPSDTFLPHSKLGFDRRTGQRWNLQSWKSEDDPGSGNLILNITYTGKSQIFLFKENHPWYRGRSYNGEIFVGSPSMKRSVITLFNHTFVNDENDVYLMYNTYDESVITRLIVHPSGFYQTFTWDSQKNQWRRYWSTPESQCDNYGTCGSNSNCDLLNYEDHQCSCFY
ncbi:hypothetical protein L6164_036505 [Bauhinia variegata]|uniref:Uncharacterized protein n=1 Tax=Bauhinia variegata TaxID=167791 RepID=A0ACB9KH96_BAUVA|nr:hypothetical protein L6164_036505 [Bauhinia variegata]